MGEGDYGGVIIDLWGMGYERVDYTVNGAGTKESALRQTYYGCLELLSCDSKASYSRNICMGLHIGRYYC
jgi:hypothetical protein